MGLQRARQESEIEDRQNDIIKCCDKIYTSSFFNMDAVTIQAISKLSKIARSSIYTYYATKEEILLDLLGQEYIFLAEDLEPTGKQDLDEDEMINCMELSKEEVLEGMGTEQFPHGLMATAMCLYLKHKA